MADVKETLKVLPAEITSVVIDVKADEDKQEAYKAINNKYLTVKPVIEEEITKTVIDYVRPDGGVGYHISLIKEVDGKKYCKMIGYGPEAKHRTHDWEDITQDEEIILESLNK